MALTKVGNKVSKVTEVTIASGEGLTVTNTGTGNTAVFKDIAGDVSPMVITANGTQVIGHTESAVPNGKVQLVGQGTDLGSTLSLSTFSGSGTIYSGKLYFYRSRSATRGVNSTVNSADTLGEIKAYASGSSTYAEAAGIVFNMDGGTPNPDLGQVSTEILLFTKDDAGSIKYASLDSTGKFGVTGTLGYGVGALSPRGSVNQLTSRTTGVTLDKPCGAITLVSAAGSTSWASFTVSNSLVEENDVIIINQKSGTDLYEIHVTNVSAGSFKVSFRTTGGTTTETPVFVFALIKG